MCVCLFGRVRESDREGESFKENGWKKRENGREKERKKELV